jgi:hypothetical protein
VNRNLPTYPDDPRLKAAPRRPEKATHGLSRVVDLKHGRWLGEPDVRRTRCRGHINVLNGQDYATDLADAARALSIAEMLTR